MTRISDSSCDLKFVDYERFPRRDLRLAVLSPLDRRTMSVGAAGTDTKYLELHPGSNRPSGEWLSANELRLQLPPWPGLRQGDLLRAQHYYYDLVC